MSAPVVKMPRKPWQCDLNEYIARMGREIEADHDLVVGGAEDVSNVVLAQRIKELEVELAELKSEGGKT